LDLLVSLEYLELLLDKLVGDFVPPRFILFCAVGMIGLVLNLGLFALLSGFAWRLNSALAVSSIVVMTANYALNNHFTFRKFRLKGLSFWKGLAAFYVACSIGLFANLRLANGLESHGIHQILAVLAGVTIGSLWNYVMSSMLVWNVRRQRIKGPA
jgi:dolichol-phosphate mannosyltransferase